MTRLWRLLVLTLQISGNTGNFRKQVKWRTKRISCKWRVFWSQFDLIWKTWCMYYYYLTSFQMSKSKFLASLNLYIDLIRNIKFTHIPCSHLMQYGSLNFSKSHIYHPWPWITNCSQAHLLSGVVDLWGAGLDELGEVSAAYPIILTHHCWLRPVQLS